MRIFYFAILFVAHIQVQAQAQEMQQTFNEGLKSAQDMLGNFKLQEAEIPNPDPGMAKEADAAAQDLILTSFKSRPQMTTAASEFEGLTQDEFGLADGGDLRVKGAQVGSKFMTCREARIEPKKKCQIIQHVEVEEIIDPEETRTLEFFRWIHTKPQGRLEDMLFSMKYKDRWFRTSWMDNFGARDKGPLTYYLNTVNPNSSPIFGPLLSYIVLKTGVSKDRIDLVSYRNYFMGRYNDRKHVIIFHKLEKKSYKLHEKVINECEGLEKIGYKLKQSTCLEGPETRDFADQKVTKNCWREERLYQASNRTTGDCGDLQAKGCKQIDSRCLDSECQSLEQTYDCGGPVEEIKIEKGPSPFCLTGNCLSNDEEFDNEMARALTEMAIIDEMGKGSKNTSFKFFSGEAKSCKDTVDKHCCAKNSGIGISTGISKCSTGEKQLAQKMAAGLCVFSSKKRSKKCVIKPYVIKTYCCFPSKLSRMLNEQGRGQLGRNFEDCAGFNISEIQSLDFDRMDLSGAFSDIKMTPIDSGKITTAIKQNLEQKARNM